MFDMAFQMRLQFMTPATEEISSSYQVAFLIRPNDFAFEFMALSSDKLDIVKDPSQPQPPPFSPVALWQT